MHEQQAEEEEERWGGGHANTEGWRGRHKQNKQTKKKNNKTRVREQALEKKVINKKNFQTKRDDTIVVPLVRRVKR